MANVTPSMRHSAFAGGTLADSTPVVVSMADAPLPANVWLSSSALGRKIEVSNDGGQWQAVGQYDTSTITQLSVKVTVGVVAVRLTGVAADTYGVQ